MERPESFCIGCERTAGEIDEYIDAAADEEMSVEDYIRKEEGTYNKENGHFLCTVCYVKAGCPSGPKGWTAP
jgi:predicted Fe-S protein YdhL (DUF1289 family)